MQPQKSPCDGLEAMATKSKAALELKRLRDHAGFSVRQLATALLRAESKYGHSPSSYAYYENDYKKPYLPADLVNALVPILTGRGDPPINEREVLVLAGTEHDSLWRRRIEFDETPRNQTVPKVDTDLLGDILERLDTEFDARSLRLHPHQRARLAAEIYEHLADASAEQKPVALQREIERVLRLVKLLLAKPD